MTKKEIKKLEKKFKLKIIIDGKNLKDYTILKNDEYCHRFCHFRNQCYDIYHLPRNLRWKRKSVLWWVKESNEVFFGTLKTLKKDYRQPKYSTLLGIKFGKPKYPALTGCCINWVKLYKLGKMDGTKKIGV